MKKNKKGKKKNKMAGRSRPGRDQSPEAEETKVPIAVSDTSETEDQADGAADSQQTSRDTEGQACDSGIDSGRGSPGEDAGLIPATGDGKVVPDAGAAADEAGDEAARKSDASTKTDTSPRTDAKLSPRADHRPQAKAESKMSPKTVDSRLSPRGSDSKVSPKLESKPNLSASRSDSKAQSRMEGKPQPKTEDRAEAGTAAASASASGTSRTAGRAGGAESSPGSVETDGAVSMKPDEPLENIKHPLEFPWEFWVIRQDVPWEEALTPCASFDSVEDFWYYFNVLKNPRIVQKPILMFKKGIRPEWEDYRNQNGGRWNLVQGLQNRSAEEVWQELALMMIGGLNFGPLTPHLNGIYCAWKADGLHYSVWIDTLDESISSSIGNTIHKCLRSILNRSFHMELVNTRAKGKKRPLLTLK